jgi:hypothetical protein
VNRPCTPAENQALAQRGDASLEAEIAYCVANNPGFDAVERGDRDLYATAAFSLAQNILIATSRHADGESFIGAVIGLGMALGATVKTHPDGDEILRLIDAGLREGINFATNAERNAGAVARGLH